ncbi:MAG: sigma-70 family RNA polymerase sigma factor [Polyangiaceae bacterium]
MSVVPIRPTPRLTPAQRAAVASDNARLLVERAARYARRHYGLDLAEGRSLGNEALVLAVLQYQPGRGASFVTYASPRVRGHILDHVLREHREAAAVRAVLDVAEGGAAEPETQEERWEAMNEERAQTEARVEQRLALMAVELVAAARAAEPASPEAQLIQHEERKRLFAALDEAMATLPDDEKEVLVQRLQGASFEVIAARLGCHVRSVARRRARALERLGAILRAQGVASAVA